MTSPLPSRSDRRQSAAPSCLPSRKKRVAPVTAALYAWNPCRRGCLPRYTSWHYPTPPSGGHGDRDEQPRHDGAKQHGVQRREGRGPAGDDVDHDPQRDRRADRQQRRHDHLPDRGLGQQIDRGADVGITARPPDLSLCVRIQPATRSPIAMHVRLVFARGIVGMIEASATRRPMTPCTRPYWPTTAPGSSMRKASIKDGKCSAVMLAIVQEPSGAGSQHMMEYRIIGGRDRSPDVGLGQPLGLGKQPSSGNQVSGTKHVRAYPRPHAVRSGYTAADNRRGR